MGYTKVIASAVSLAFLLDEVLEISLFQQELWSASVAKASGETCIPNEIGHFQICSVRCTSTEP